MTTLRIATRKSPLALWQTEHVAERLRAAHPGLAVELVGHFPELAREQAEGVMKAAHEVCPYSKATRGNIEVTLSVA